MSSIVDDPADCFCSLFDAIDTAPFRDGRALDWLGDAGTEGAVTAVAEAVRNGTFTRADADASIVAAADSDRRRLELLRGLDRALGDAHPLWGRRVSGPLADVADRVLLTGRLDTGAADGALWPRYNWGADESLALEHPQAAFLHVLRIPPEVLAQLSRTVLEEPHGPGPSARADLRFACAPMIEAYDEVRFDGADVGYALRPVDGRLSGRPTAALRAMDDADAVVGCAPEGALDGDLLAEWRAAAASPRPAGSALQFVLAGTGPVDGALVGSRGANEAVLLERLTGTEILRQRKRSRFTMRASQIKEWQLEAHLGDEDLTEDIVLGDRLSVVECSLGRIAVAVCEDVARLTKLGATVGDAGVSLLLVPVFSKELRQHFWEDAAAKAYANGVGAHVLIVNSLAVARAREAADPPIRGGPVAEPGWHTAMLRGEDFRPGRADAGAEVAVIESGWSGPAHPVSR